MDYQALLDTIREGGLSTETMQYYAVGFSVFIVIVSLWDTAWKGWALWRAAQMKSRNMFILLLIVNSMGIFPIIYLIVTNEKYKALTQSPARTLPQSPQNQRI